MKSNINTILPIAICLILPGLSIYTSMAFENMDTGEFLLTWLFTSSFLYLIWHLLWLTWDRKIRYQKLSLVIGTIAFIIIAFGFLGRYVFYQVGVTSWSNFVRIPLAVVLFLSIQYALRAQENIARLLVEKEQLLTENYKTQLKALQAQIDPHFLFNSLNTLRSMVRQNHASSEKFIMSLSDFYRKTLKHNENATLPLSEEIKVLQAYLFLMKSRNEEAMNVDLNVEESLTQMHLPTFGLQLVVENCFKHNSMTSKSPLNIEIGNNDDSYIIVKNNIQPKLGEDEPSGIGLDLLKKRYELMSIKEGVIVEETPSEFSTKLKLIKR